MSSVEGPWAPWGMDPTGTGIVRALRRTEGERERGREGRQKWFGSCSDGPAFKLALAAAPAAAPSGHHPSPGKAQP